MPRLAVNGIDIAYEQLGEGEPVVFLPGTGTGGSVFLAQTAVLSERYRCIVVDNRDSGASGAASASYTPADLARDAAAVADALGTGPSHVVGYSLGGAAAQELAIARPDLVRSLVLVATWARTDAWFAAQMRNWMTIRRAHRDDDEAFLRALLPWVLSPTTYALPGMVDGVVTLGLAQEPRQPPEAFVRQCEANVAHDAGERLRGVEAPALVVVGDADICTAPRYAAALSALLPRAEQALVAGAAHGALFEDPDTVNAAILDFLERH